MRGKPPLGRYRFAECWLGQCGGGKLRFAVAQRGHRLVATPIAIDRRGRLFGCASTKQQARTDQHRCETQQVHRIAAKTARTRGRAPVFGHRLCDAA
ncbi:MAG: hypothetical protein B7Z39_02410 [Novosphingobium sp. 12-64-8]|nr:MAG: hypothetical protein B7Z39_02410 [Novosphingobium sp. 12-64-8]